MFISVDLPEPEDPTIATISPLLDGQADVLQRHHDFIARRKFPA